MRQSSILALAASLLLGGAVPGGAWADSNSSAPPSALEQLKRKPLNQRVAVSIYQFRSDISQISADTATDMFMTALVKSGQFRVVERNRLDAGIDQEKRKNAAGQTTGKTAQHPLRGAQYLFEGAVTESNAGANNKQGGINIGGFQLGGTKNKDVIAIDVRILDADTGDVLDSLTVSRPVKGSSVGISGTAALAGTIAAAKGGSASAFVPDVTTQNSSQDGVDSAVRACIEDAVLELAKRTELTPPEE